MQDKNDYLEHLNDNAKYYVKVMRDAYYYIFFCEEPPRFGDNTIIFTDLLDGGEVTLINSGHLIIIREITERNRLVIYNKMRELVDTRLQGEC